jgi:hypothetical protein
MTNLCSVSQLLKMRFTSKHYFLGKHCRCQKIRNHVDVSLMRVLNIIFQERNLSKKEFFFHVISCVLQRKKFITLSFLLSES